MLKRTTQLYRQYQGLFANVQYYISKELPLCEEGEIETPIAVRKSPDLPDHLGNIVDIIIEQNQNSTKIKYLLHPGSRQEGDQDRAEQEPLREVADTTDK